MLCCFPLSYFSFDTLCIYIGKFEVPNQPIFRSEDIEETYVKASTCQDLGQLEGLDFPREMGRKITAYVFPGGNQE